MRLENSPTTSEVSRSRSKLRPNHSPILQFHVWLYRPLQMTGNSTVSSPKKTLQVTSRTPLVCSRSNELTNYRHGCLLVKANLSEPTVVSTISAKVKTTFACRRRLIQSRCMAATLHAAQIFGGRLETLESALQQPTMPSACTLDLTCATRTPRSA